MSVQVRARHLKSLIESIDQHPQAAAIRARVPAQLLAGIEASFGFDWCPMEWDIVLTRAVGEVVDEGVEAFFKQAMRASFQGPLLRTLVETGLRMFGADPGTAATWVPRGWQLIFQGCGRWRVVGHAQGRAELAIEDLPPECAVDDLWPRSVTGAMAAVASITSDDGTARLEQFDPQARSASYVLVWTPR
ncbi:MAG: hypothetical protein QM767_02820 [Anaeromyxobacter sp.]